MATKNGMSMFATLLLSVLLLSATTIRARSLAKPDCQERCGNVRILYPFGIGKGCYLDEGFEVECKLSHTNNRTVQPILEKGGGLIMQELTLDTVYVNQLKISTCFSETKKTANKSYNIKGGLFGLDDKNKLTVIGCDVYAYVTDTENKEPSRTSGCQSVCDNGNSYQTNGSCSGSGCCQIDIPYGMTIFTMGLTSIKPESRSWNSTGDHCSTAVIAPKESQNFGNGTMINWWIDGKCKESICSEGTFCYAPFINPRYLCYCTGPVRSLLDLEIGNPYLPGSCIQDTGPVYVPEEPGHSRKLSPVHIALIAVGGGILLGTFLNVIAFWIHARLKRKKIIELKNKFYKRNGGLILEQQISSGERNIHKPTIFVQQELDKATDNFSENRVLGMGGFGTVYKGMLEDGRIVAIKKSKIVDENQIGQFINELVILSQINHRHIVKVLGCCLETEVPLLVYEFVSNGTLSEHLHKEDHIVSISWKDRLRISKEIAGALSYLHSAASTPIFHRDIKSSNILLDENYKAKVSDFGLSRSVPEERTHLTTLVKGTFGYLDPEYVHSSQYTDKSDVYSFGVVFVELLTGQQPVSFTRSVDEANLAMTFINSVKEDRILEILEARIVKEAKTEDIKAVASLAKKCLKLNGKKRPTMKEVVLQLENLSVFQHQDSNCLLKD